MNNKDWQLPEGFMQEYLAECRLAVSDNEVFKTFRTLPKISTIIENTPIWWAEKAMAKMGITPTIVRYQYIWWLMRLLVKGMHERPYHFVEIGGGYGGQSEVILNTEAHLDYTIYDLSPVLDLQMKYLRAWDNKKMHFMLPDEPFIDQASLCLSWCAWSELSLENRLWYAENVISKCNHVFICSNYNYEEDKAILLKYFPDLKEYSDDIVSNVLYC